jgi:hypothetical protein
MENVSMEENERDKRVNQSLMVAVQRKPSFCSCGVLSTGRAAAAAAVHAQYPAAAQLLLCCCWAAQANHDTSHPRNVRPVFLITDASSVLVVVASLSVTQRDPR